ncbi:hypothetical protein PNOK_0595200 [Pyrrhoderma noxium]|uniref:FAD NAD-binding domain-containing n=1 Tax=Pyrrhoderma noxium TaxID=2282107 RepID=A0A286UHT6_9AGAM|nr:hypothetical protein PNOK_0595200 [Pyrrhoderma noxium]
MPSISLRQGAILVFGAFIARILYNAVAASVKTYITKRDTIMLDLPELGKSRPKDKKIKGTAVVCGGSFSGLWTARFLTDHFEDVLIVEAEAWLGTPEGQTPKYDSSGAIIDSGNIHPRTRAYQNHCTHALHSFPYKIMKQLYPSLDDEVVKFDGRVAESDHNAYVFGKKILQTPLSEDGTRPKSWFLSREALERLLRKLVLGNSPSIRWLAGTAKGLEVSKDNLDRVTGVEVRLPDNTEKVIPATLVVDCTGSTQAGLKWLKRIGSPADKTGGGKLSLEDAKTFYNVKQWTRTYRFPAPPEARSRLPIPGGYDKAVWMFTYFPLFGRGRRSFLIDKIEGHRIRIMFGAWGDERPPDFHEINDYIRHINPDEKMPEWIHELVDILLENKDKAEITDTKYPPLTYLRYDKLAYVPSNFIAVGDSVMQPNPTFGQGIAKACVCSVTVDSLLRSKEMIESTTIPTGFSTKFFKVQAQRTESAWNGAKAIDYLFPFTVPMKGEKRRDGLLDAKLTGLLLLLGRTDDVVMKTVYNSFGFMASPLELLHPSILIRLAIFRAKQLLGFDFDPYAMYEFTE